MTLNEFTAKVQKKHTPKHFKINGSIGVYDIYKKLRKEGWKDIGKPVSEHDFYSIVRTVNDILAESLVNGESVKFPSRMGTLEIRKFSVGCSFEDGKLKVTYPVDWKKTLKLWHEDADAYRKKILIRNENKEVFRVAYSKRGVNYNNKKFYDFEVNRFIKRKLKDNINAGIIDTLW